MDKKIQRMFSEISDKYDFLNHLLSFGQDIFWRKKVANIIKDLNGNLLFDIACGTGDLGIEILKKRKDIEVIGIDFCFEMVEIGKKKTSKITYINGDATKLPLKDCVADFITIAFGIRNIPERKKALMEFYRILRKGGYLIIMEFSIPENSLFKFYFERVLPFIGGLFSSKEAYTYLPNSVKYFPSPKKFKEELREIKFNVLNEISLSLGTVRIYICKKGVG